jgi:hypothetical protein
MSSFQKEREDICIVGSHSHLRLVCTVKRSSATHDASTGTPGCLDLKLPPSVFFFLSRRLALLLAWPGSILVRYTLSLPVSHRHHHLISEIRFQLPFLRFSQRRASPPIMCGSVASPCDDPCSSPSILLP